MLKETLRTNNCFKHGDTQFTEPNLSGKSFCVQCLRDFEQACRNNPGMMAEAQRTFKEKLQERTGAELVAAGYMQVSRKYQTVARLPPGKTAIEAMKELHPRAYQRILEDIEQSAQRQYLRLYARADGNTLELTEEQFNAFRAAGGQLA